MMIVVTMLDGADDEEGEGEGVGETVGGGRGRGGRRFWKTNFLGALRIYSH